MEDYVLIEIVAALTLPATLTALIVSGSRGSPSSGITVLFLVLGTALPVILILALERIIEPGTIGTLLGIIFGYALSMAVRAASER